MPLTSANSTVAIDALETATDVEMGPAQKRHRNNAGAGVYSSDTANGTSSGQGDRVYSDVDSLAGTTRSINLTTITSKLDGTALAFLKITELWIYNKATTTAYNLLVGAGSNPIVSLWGATGDIIKIPPGGHIHLTSPIDGFAVIATTGDILKIDSGANTVPYEIIIIGRSA
jgi:hypothetical protein